MKLYYLDVCFVVFNFYFPMEKYFGQSTFLYCYKLNSVLGRLIIFRLGFVLSST